MDGSITLAGRRAYDKGIRVEYWSFLGAFIACYAVSRVFLRAFSTLRPWRRVATANLASFALLALLAGFWKAYFTAFAFEQAMVFFSPQLLWFVFDIIYSRAAKVSA